MSKSMKRVTPVLFILIGLFIFVFPLLTLFKMAFEVDGTFSTVNFTSVLSSPRALLAIKNTIMIAVASTILSTIVEGLLALIVAYTNIKMKKVIETLVILPYVIPGYVVTLSWTSMFSVNGFVNNFLTSLSLPKVNMYSIGGIIFVLGISNSALVYLNLIDVLRKIPQEQEWASMISGYTMRESLKNINLRSLISPIVSGVVLSFLSSIDNFAIPITLGSSSGIFVLSTYIYEKAIGFGPTSFNEASVLAIILAGLSLITLFVQWHFLKKAKNLESVRPNYESRINLSQTNRTKVQFLIISVLVMINIIPLLFMLLSSLHSGYTKSIFDISNISFSNYTFIFNTPSMYKGFITSFNITMLAILICIVLGVWVMYYKNRIGNKATLLIESGASLTYSVPGIILSLSMIFYWNKVPNVYGTIKMLVIAYVTRYALLIMRGSNTAFSMIDNDLEAAALIAGSSQFEKWRKVVIPMIKNQIMASSFLMFVGAFTELSLSSLLAAAGTKTVGLTIFNLQTSGDNSVAQAYSVIVTLFILLILFLRNICVTKGDKENESTNN